MQRNIQRTLVIGLGPSGALVAERLRSILEVRYQGVPYIGFLVVDLSTEASAVNAGVAPTVFAPHEQIFALPAEGMIDFIEQSPSVKLMIPAGVTLDIEAEYAKFSATRLGANLLFQRQATRGIAQSVWLALDESLRRLFDPPAEWASRNDFQPDAHSNAVAVYVVASVAEPWAGGPLPDLMYLLNSLPRVDEGRVQPETHGVLMLFDQNTDTERPLSETGRACTYATLAEINRLFAGGPFENPYLQINSTALPFTHSCNLVDLENEVGYSLQSADNATSMVAEWLAQVIVEPPGDVGGNRIPSSLRNEGEIRAYSSFGLARQGLYIQEIQDYYANRFGADLFKEAGLLTRQVDSRTSGVAAENFEKAPVDSEMDPDNSLDMVSLLKSHQDSFRCRIALNEMQERIVTNLWPDAISLTFAEPNLEPSFHRVSLSALGRRIEEAITRQQDHLEGYQQQVADKCDREILPLFKERLARQTWALTDSHPIGGLELAQQFLAEIRSRVAKERKRLQTAREQTDADANAARQTLERVQEEGRLALRNYPRIRPLMRRVGIIFLATLLVILLAYSANTTRDLVGVLRFLWQAVQQGMILLRASYFLPLLLWITFLVLMFLALWRSQARRPESYRKLIGDEGRLSWLWTGIEISFWTLVLVLMTVGIFGLTRSGILDPTYNFLMLIGAVATAKILVWDFLFGLARSGTPNPRTGQWEGGQPPDYNLPSWLALFVAELLLVGLTLLCVSWSRDLPDASSIWTFLALLTILLGGLLGFWTWYDEREIRRKAELWMMARNNYASLALRSSKLELGQRFYDQANENVESTDTEVKSFSAKLATAGKDYAVQMQQQHQHYISLSERRFTRPLMSWERLTELYALIVPSAQGEVAQGGAEGAHTLFKQMPDMALAVRRLSDWRRSDARQIHDDLVAFIGQRFAATWTKVGITDLLVGSGEAFPERSYQQELQWIMMEASKPYWRYRGYQGQLAAYVGLGNVEDRNLRKAVEGFTAAMGAPPELFAIDSQHVITCLGFRHNLPLSLIRSVQDCRSAYETLVAKTPTLHARK